MAKTSVDLHFEQYKDLLGKIDPSELSILTSVNDNYRKSLILSAASFFEKKVVDEISKLPNKRIKNYLLLKSFLENQALKRKFHSLFDWEKDNANKFFGLFGGDFKNFMHAKITADPRLKTGIEAFMLIGNERNKMVHNDYGSYQLDKNADEVFSTYKNANYFVEQLPLLFHEFSST